MDTPTVYSMLQTIYNLNWKGRSEKDSVKFVQYLSNGRILTITPTALELYNPITFIAYTVSWELYNDKIINMGLCGGLKAEQIPGLYKILKDYMGIE